MIDLGVLADLTLTMRIINEANHSVIISDYDETHKKRIKMFNYGTRQQINRQKSVSISTGYNNTVLKQSRTRIRSAIRKERF